MDLHVAVVMPDHVHLVLTPQNSETGDPFTFEEILGGIKAPHPIQSAFISVKQRQKGFAILTSDF